MRWDNRRPEIVAHHGGRGALENVAIPRMSAKRAERKDDIGRRAMNRAEAEKEELQAEVRSPAAVLPRSAKLWTSQSSLARLLAVFTRSDPLLPLTHAFLLRSYYEVVPW